MKASGKMSVERFEKEFEEEFGIRIEIKQGGELADNQARLASLRPADYQGPKSNTFTVSGRMHVKNVKAKLKEVFGIDTELYFDDKIAPEDITLAALRRGDLDGSAPVSSGKISTPSFDEILLIRVIRIIDGDVYENIIEDSGILIKSDYNNNICTISSDTNNVESKAENYWDFITDENYANYFEGIAEKAEISLEFLTSLIQCILDEDEDGMYDYIEENGGELEFIYPDDEADAFGFTDISDYMDAVGLICTEIVEETADGRDLLNGDYDIKSERAIVYFE